MYHGVLAATQDWIHLKKDLSDSRGPSTSYWGAKAWNLKAQIDAKIAGNDITFAKYGKKYKHHFDR